MNERTTIYAKQNPVSTQTCLIHRKICTRFDNPYQLSRYHSKKVYIYCTAYEKHLNFATIITISFE